MKNMVSKIKFLAVTAVAGLLATAVSGVAGPQVRANVPFAFEAGTSKMPAGLYLIERASNGHSIKMVNLDNSTTVFLAVMNSGNVAMQKGPRLVFEQLGESYRLSDVKMSAGVPSDSIPRSKKQALVAKEQREQVLVEVALD
jgi:hypothetical protein